MNLWKVYGTFILKEDYIKILNKMKKANWVLKISLGLGILVLLGATSCSESTKDAAEATADSAIDDTNDHIEGIKDDINGAKDDLSDEGKELQKSLEQTLANIDLKIAKLEADIDKKSNKIDANKEQAIKDLEKERMEAEASLYDIKNDMVKDWKAFKKKVADGLRKTSDKIDS